jgi:RimJ/RimL family protein N-acetyltransferase
LETARLRLRPFHPSDAEAVRLLAGEYEVARYVLSLPHPYEAGMARAWIAAQPEEYARGRSVIFAVTLREAGTLLGSIGLCYLEHHRAELDYWLGRAHWGQGFCTEAGRTVLRYGFEELGLNRIFARYFSENQASGGVLCKLGFRREGTLRRHVERFGEFHDLEVCGLLREEYAEKRAQLPG